MSLLLYWRAGGSSHCVDVKGDGTVADLKREIARCGGPPAVLSQVLFQGRTLLDDTPLSETGLSAECTVEVHMLQSSTITAGLDHSAAILTSGKVVVWGGSKYNQWEVPPLRGKRVVKLAPGATAMHLMVLLEDGSVVAWGRNHCGQTDVPELHGTAVDVAVADKYSAAVTDQGTLELWGELGFLSVTGGRPPSRETARGDFVRVAAADNSCAALTRDGKVTVLGKAPAPDFGGKNVIDIAAGKTFIAAVLDDGDVKVWGTLSPGAPERRGKYRAIAAGGGHLLAVEGGQVFGWGEDGSNQCTPRRPLQNVRHIAAGLNHSLAVLTSGKVICWGSNCNLGGYHVGQATKPALEREERVAV